MDNKATEKVISQAQYTIVDLLDGSPGEDGYTVILSNDTHAIECNFLGNPVSGEIGFPNCKASSSIVVYKGEAKLTAVGENDTVTNGKFKYSIEPKTIDSTCLGARATNDKFYLKELYSDSGELLITITLDNGKTVLKRFTWSKIKHGEDAKYVKILGETEFIYRKTSNAKIGNFVCGEDVSLNQTQRNITVTPTSITLEAYVYNIKNYTLTWEYLNEAGNYVNVISQNGSLIQGNNLIVDDKKLFGNRKLCKIKITCLDRDFNKTYVDEIVIHKIYDGTDGETGEPGKSVSITGLTSFHYDNKQDSTSSPNQIILTPNLNNIVNKTIKWQYRNTQTQDYKDITKVNSDNTITVNDKDYFANYDIAEFHLVVQDLDNYKYYYATHTITKVYDGKDSYTCILTNEADAIIFDENGVIKPGQIGSSDSKSKSDVIVKKGYESLTAISSALVPSTGQYKIIFEPYPVNCTAALYGNSSFYLKTISPNATNGKVSVTIYLEGNVNKVVKEYTWTKVIDGVDAKYVILEGEDKFVYDDPNDNTSTPSTITLTATAHNITNPTYKWKYNNGQMVDVISGVGSVINGNTLTINDTKLFPNNAKSTKIQCTVSHNGTDYSDTKSIIKVYDGETGPVGPPGEDSKTVTISGISQIRYDKNNTPTPSSITLTATHTNYVNPNYKWYYVTSSGDNLIANQTSNTLTVPHNSSYFHSDMALIKVECRESNGQDLSSFEHTIIKVFDGIDSTSLTLNITDGTRNVCYNGKNTLITTAITPFRFELFEEDTNVTSSSSVRSITWSCKGHYEVGNANVGAISFTPTPKATYDENKLDTVITLTINYKGRIIKQSAPIAVSKNSTALDWVEEWDGSKVAIGNEYIISPKIFAGKKNTQTNRITGIALGQDIINKNPNIGMAIYYENNLIGRINADPSVDNNNMVVLGATPGKQILIKTNGEAIIEGGMTVSASETTTIGDIYTNTVTAQETANNAKNLALAMQNGKMIYTDPVFKKGTNNVIYYNNAGGGTVAVTRIAKISGCPTSSTHCLEVKTTGAANPSHGGFHLSITSRANAVFLQKFIAKLPVGRTLNLASNSMGTGYSDRWLTSNIGTGKWETYIREVKCGDSGSFSSGGHVYVSGGSTPTASSPLVWHLAYATVYDITDNDETMNEVLTWKETATNQLKPGSITDTVSKALQSDGKPLFVQTSIMEQTANNLEVKFSQSGGRNLLKNTKGLDSTKFWMDNGGGLSVSNDDVFDKCFKSSWPTGISYAGGENTHYIKLKNDTHYIYEAYIKSQYPSKGSPATPMHFWCRTDQITGSDQFDIIDYKQNIEADTWCKCYVHFKTKPTGNCWFRPFIYLGGNTTGIFYVTEISLSEGSVPTPWTPNPNESYDGIINMSSDGVEVSMQDGEGSQGSTLISHDGFSVKDGNGNAIAHFGQGNTAQIGELRVKGQIHNDYILKKALYAPNYLYISPTATGDGTGRDANNKSSTIKRAIEWYTAAYGNYLCSRDLIIDIANGTYHENICISGFIGVGVIKLNFQSGAVWYGEHKIEENAPIVYFIGRPDYNSWSDGGARFIYRGSSGHLFTVRSSTVWLSGVRGIKEGWSGNLGEWNNYSQTFLLSLGANVYVYNNDVVGFYNFICAYDLSRIGQCNNRGHCYRFAEIVYGSLIQGRGHTPLHSVGAQYESSGAWWDLGINSPVNSFFQPKSANPQPPPPVENWQWVEASFSVTNLRSIPEGSGSGTSPRYGEIGQGKWGSYKPHRGHGDINGISGWCSGGRNFTVYVTLTRLNTSHGYAGSTPRPRFVKPDGNIWDCGIGFARGATHTITLESSIANAIVSGSMNTLSIWASTSINDYSFYNNVSIRVVCQKNLV